MQRTAPPAMVQRWKANQIGRYVRRMAVTLRPHTIQQDTPGNHPDELLLEIIARGGDPALGSKMPGFENTLPADKIQAILAFIKSHWGDEEMAFQWWITAR